MREALARKLEELASQSPDPEYRRRLLEEADRVRNAPSTNRMRSEAVDKSARLSELARKRRGTRWSGYACIGDYHAGAYECDFVSPYTKSAHNYDAAVMVLLQDWASDEGLRGRLDIDSQTLGYTASAPANVNLQRLLEQHFGLRFEDVYATNLFPFVKPGPMNARIKMSDLELAAKEFALPQIEIVRPRLVVCLGKATFNALARAANARCFPTLAQAIPSPFRFGATEVWCQAHTGMIGQNGRNRGGIDRVSEDWARMAAGYRSRMQPDRACSTGPAGRAQTMSMTNEFTAVVERDGEWFIAYCAEIPGANGQGRTKEEALESLSAGVALILEDRREDALRGLPADAIQEKVTVK